MKSFPNRFFKVGALTSALAWSFICFAGNEPRAEEVIEASAPVEIKGLQEASTPVFLAQETYYDELSSWCEELTQTFKDLNTVVLTLSDDLEGLVNTPYLDHLQAQINVTQAALERFPVYDEEELLPYLLPSYRAFNKAQGCLTTTLDVLETMVRINQTNLQPSTLKACLENTSKQLIRCSDYLNEGIALMAIEYE